MTDDAPPAPLPKTRGDCPRSRPCQHVACRYHMRAEDSRYKLSPARTAESCAIDIADRGEHSLQEIAELYGVSRERIRQIEANAIRKVTRRLPVFVADPLDGPEETSPAPMPVGDAWIYDVKTDVDAA